MQQKTYIDQYGYLRFKDSDKLVHRRAAYKYLYEPNCRKFDYPFSYYRIHHIDRNKLNNDINNLEILTREEHEKIHNIETMNTQSLIKNKEKDNNWFSNFIIYAIVWIVIIAFTGWIGFIMLILYLLLTSNKGG